MDLGLAGSKAVVTGGSKGMGLAIAETLAAEGASVAVMARNRAALDAAVESLREAGAPEAVGISVDMADAASITAGFAAVSERWGQLNCLVHTSVRAMGISSRWTTRNGTRRSRCGTMSGVRSIRASLPARRRLGTHRDPVRLRFSGRIRGSSPTQPRRQPVQRHQELVEEPCQGRHPGQYMCPAPS